MRNKVVLALVGAAILAISCNKDGLFQQSVKDGNGGQEVHGVISLKDGNKIEMSHLGGEMQMSFTTGETWHIDGYTSDVAKWLSIYPTSGKVGTTILNVKTDANVVADHSVKLRIVNGSGDSELVSFSVNQPVIVFDVNLKDTGEPFRWNHFVRTRDDKDKPVFNGAKGQKTITIDSNIGWRIDVTEESTQGWCDFDNKSVQSITSRQDKVNILPDRRNFTDTKSLKATIVPLVPSGDDWVRLQELDPLEFTLTQDFLIYRTQWQGLVSSDGVKVLGALPYSVAADSDHMASFTVSSELDWQVQQCPDWLELWLDSEATKHLSGTIKADTQNVVTVWVRTKYANPHTAARTDAKETAILLRPIDDDAEDIPLPVNQEPFVFDFRHNGAAVSAPGVTVEPFKSGDSKIETFSIAATGVVDSSWLVGDIPDDWLESQVSDAGNEITFRIAEGKQRLEFTPETTSLTVRPPRDWFDSADAGQDLQRQLSFTQEGFVFKLSGERKDYLSRIGNKATINNSDPTEISVDCTGEWYATISYGTDTKDWVAEKDNKLYNNSSFSSGLTTLKVGASSFNPEAQNRTATLTFISKTHEQKGRLDISGARITLPVSQMAYQLHMSQTDGGSHLTKLDPVPAYLPDGFKLFLTCSGAWDMVCPEFLVPSRASFDNDEKEFEEFINFTVKPNPSKDVSYTDKYIIISPRSGNLPPLRIPVSQDPLTFEFKPADVVLPAYSENNVSIGSLKLTPGVKWTLSCEGKDISEFSGKTATGSLETLKVPLIYENDMGNLSSASRSLTYTVSVNEPKGVSPETITLPQEAFIWSVRNTDEENKFGFDFDPVPAESDKINLQVQSSGGWKIEGKGDYINETRNGENVTLTPTKNLDRSTSREYTLRIKSDYYEYNTNLIQELLIRQPRFEWSVSKDNLSWDSPVNTDEKTFRVESSGPWKLVYESSEVTSSGGTLDGWKFEWSDSGESVDVTVTPSKNNSYSEHKTVVSVVSIEHQNARQDLSSMITLSQPKYVLEVRRGQETLSFDAWNRNNENAQQEQTLYVTSTDGCDWDIKSNASWLSFSSKRNDSVSIWAENYSNTQSDREATLTISSAEDGITLKRTVNVTQSRFVFKTKNSSETNLSFGLDASSKDVQIECSAAWEISSVPDKAFATVTKKDDNTLHIDVSKSSKERTGEIVLASHGNELKINLTQKK